MITLRLFRARRDRPRSRVEAAQERAACAALYGHRSGTVEPHG